MITSDYIDSKMNTIINADCLEVMAKIPDNYFDLVLTSPPYDSLRGYETMDFEKFKMIAKQLYRILKNGGVIVWIVKDQTINGSESLTSFKQAIFFNEIGLRVHDTMIWSKDTFSMPDKTRYRDTHEYMFVLSKGKPKTINLIKDRQNKWAGTKVHGTSREANNTLKRKRNHNKKNVGEIGVGFNVWNIPTEKKSSKWKHPAMFPLEIASKHIKSWAAKGDKVFDPFMGSGTTAVACKSLGLDWCGCELENDYCDIANKRLEKVQGALL